MTRAELLTPYNVSILTETDVGRHRETFVNSERERAMLRASAYPQTIIDQIFEVWGSEPTVITVEQLPSIELPEPQKTIEYATKEELSEVRNAMETAIEIIREGFTDG